MQRRRQQASDRQKKIFDRTLVESATASKRKPDAFEIESILCGSAKLGQKSPSKNQKPVLPSKYTRSKLPSTESSISLSVQSPCPTKFKINKNQIYQVLNRSSSTEVSIRSDILREFETKSEKARREQREEDMRLSLIPEQELVQRSDF